MLREVKIIADIDRNTVADAVKDCPHDVPTAALISKRTAVDMLKFARGGSNVVPERFTDAGLLWIVVPEHIVPYKTLIFVSATQG
jgi:hypothetical protein